LVETDKVGIGTFFWALPSKGFQVRKNLIEDYEKKLATVKADIEKTGTDIEKAKEERASNDGEREQMIEDLKAA